MAGRADVMVREDEKNEFASNETLRFNGIPYRIQVLVGVRGGNHMS
jgi:hypothetical protein